MAAALAVVALVRGIRRGFYTDVGIVVVQCNSENVCRSMVWAVSI